MLGLKWWASGGPTGEMEQGVYAWWEWRCRRVGKASLDSRIVTQGLYRQPWPLTPASTQLYVNGHIHVRIMLDVARHASSDALLVCSVIIDSCPKVCEIRRLRNLADHFMLSELSFPSLLSFPCVFLKPLSFWQYCIVTSTHPITTAGHEPKQKPDFFRWCKILICKQHVGVLHIP